MTNDSLLLMLKYNLQITSSSYDTYLEQLLESAYAYITTEGITITKVVDEDDSDVYTIEDIGDCNLIVMYAAYLYRKRADEGSPAMPRMLRYALNNRLFSQKMQGDTEDES